MPMPFRNRRRSGPLLQPTRQYGPLELNPNANGTLVPRDLGFAPFLPSQPQGLSPQNRIVLPEHNFPPPDAIAYDEITDANITNGTTVVLQSFQVPDSYTWRIAGIGFGADDESGLRFLTWTLRQTPPLSSIQGYVNKPAGIGSIPQVSVVYVVLGSSIFFELLATNNAPVPVTYHYFVRVQGWLYQVKEAR